MPEIGLMRRMRLMHGIFLLATIALIFSMPSAALAFTMQVQPTRISAPFEKADFKFGFNGLKDGNYEIEIAVPGCVPGESGCAPNYASIIAANPGNGTCGYYPKEFLVKCRGTISGTTRAEISFAALDSKSPEKPVQRASEKWSAQVKNSGKTEKFSQIVFFDWNAANAGDSNTARGADANSGAGTGVKTQKQKAWQLSAQDFVLAIEAVVVIALIAYVIGRSRKPRQGNARRARMTGRHVGKRKAK